MRRLVSTLGALAALAMALATPSAGAATATTAYACTNGPQTKLFDNSNIFGVIDGGKPPSFSTHGQAFCVTSITTYHWNDGLGSRPGTIALRVASGLGGKGSTLGPFRAAGSSGQGGARNVNWTVTPPPGKLVIDGSYACQDSDPATWSQNQASHGRGFCVVEGVPAAPKPTGYRCTGGPLKLFDNSNGFAVQNGGTPPSFSTGGAPYCLTELVTYHWNNGLGSAPGTIGLGVVAGLGGAGNKIGPFKATGSVGQGGTPNVNWTASLPATGKPAVIDGTYSCLDSDQATWSQNQATGGHGFCQVYVTRATPTFGPSPKPKPKPKPRTNPPTPKCRKGKLGIAATPDSGKPPLTVTFALCSPKVVQWRIDYGDGQSKVATGSPPASITHTYRLEGDFRPTLTVLATPASAIATSVSTSVSVHPAQLISLTANPPSGMSPLVVRFSLATTVKHVTSWAIDFGDGARTGGSGAPPASVSHTYTGSGSFQVIFTVKPGQLALVSTLASVTVGGGTPPVLSLTATPTSGSHPLHVTFSITDNIPGRIVSWELQFGDGQAAAGRGKPPAAVSHTYAHRGVDVAFLLVSQQQQYGGVLYVYPRGGLIISVG